MEVNLPNETLNTLINLSEATPFFVRQFCSLWQNLRPAFRLVRNQGLTQIG